MKKLIAVILAILIVVAVMIPMLTVSAMNNATFVIGDASGKVGENVDVTVSIKNNPGITALQVMIDYSAEELKLVSINDEGLFNDSISNSKLTNNPFKISWYSQDSVDESDSGVLATLTFKILKNFDESKINISYDADNVFDIGFDNVSFETKNGVVSVESEVETTVTEPSESVIPTEKTEPTIDVDHSSTATEPSSLVTEPSSGNTEPSSTEATEPSSGTTEPEHPFLLGDANLDTVVNVKDATTVQKYVASLIDLSEEAKLCADFDQNENINVKDATGIQKRVAGLI